MPKQKKPIIEYRDYELPIGFPVILLSGENWHISDKRSGRLHFHNCTEIGMCLTDSGFMEYDGEKHAFHAGDITFMSRHVPHTTYSSPGESSLWSYLFFDPYELLMKYFNDAFPHAELCREMLENSRMILSGSEHPEINSLVNQIVSEIQEKPLNYQFSVTGLFLSLIMQFLRLYHSEKHKTPQVNAAGRSQSGSNTDPAGTADASVRNSLIIAPALYYIRTNYWQDFSVDTLADQCHLSLTHFRRIFQEIMQTNPLDYLNTTRIQEACTLLRMTEDSVLSISERVGFSSVSSFNRHFMAIMNVTPSDYRKDISKAEKSSILKYAGWMQAQVPKD
ncbi:MAG: helix-turn-helix transcriptional regulator [Lachnospiraceae bacterium]|nr:helix-turn-helix transcriptional regulator [Lachnospiraceae bacterium]